MAWTEPHTYVPGEMVTAATLNTDWRDNQAWLVGDTAWIAPIFQNAWVNYGGGFQSAGYRRLGDLVFLRGLVKSGTVGAGTPIFTLPAGYRPPINLVFVTIGNNVIGRLNVNPDGTVAFNNGNNGFVTLDDVVFSVI